MTGTPYLLIEADRLAEIAEHPQGSFMETASFVDLHMKWKPKHPPWLGFYISFWQYLCQYLCLQELLELFWPIGIWISFNRDSERKDNLVLLANFRCRLLYGNLPRGSRPNVSQILNLNIRRTTLWEYKKMLFRGFKIGKCLVRMLLSKRTAGVSNSFFYSSSYLNLFQVNLCKAATCFFLITAQPIVTFWGKALGFSSFVIAIFNSGGISSFMHKI